MSRFLALCVFLLALAGPARAQEQFWVQIEARQTLTAALDRARVYARQFDDVYGFYLGSGFYGILIGPFTEDGAATARQGLLANPAIPRDIFVKQGGSLQQQFWPVGVSVAPAAPVTPPAADPAPAVVAPPPVVAADETPQQARASESLLDFAARQHLQRKLEWAGVYQGAIDGAFGRGTRAAMAAWQQANNLPDTGVLTTGQRALLQEQYDAVLSGLGLETLRDEATGISLLVPSQAVRFAAYDPPFARFDATGAVEGAQLLLISQAGDRARLDGLYTFLQAFDIIPPEGPRGLTRDGFTIEGSNARVQSYTTVTLRDGAIKGFTLVWPVGDDARRDRLLAEMQASFAPFGGVLDPAIVPASEDQAIDMVSGLQLRLPRQSRSGVFVSGAGDVVTTAEAVAGCERITLDRDTPARVLATDAALGISLLRPDPALAPRRVAPLRQSVPRLQDRIAVAGYPFEGALPAPTLTFGTIADIRSLTGDDRIKRLSIVTQDGDTGGPVLDMTGAMLGMLLPRADSATRVLPPEVNFALDAGDIAAFLTQQGITAALPAQDSALDAAILAEQAAEMTVLVGCW